MIIFYLPSCTGAVLRRKESSSGKGPIWLGTTQTHITARERLRDREKVKEMDPERKS